MAKSNWRNVKIRVLLVGVVVLTLTSGPAIEAQTAGTAPASTVPPVLRPAAAITPPPSKEPVRGIIRAVETAMISTELTMRASRIGFLEGERFKKGDVLVEFDCRKPRAELAAAEAQHHEMKLTLDNNRVLQRAQAVGRHDLDISASRVTKAAAEAEALRVRLDQCRVVAPYDGRILDLSLHALETPQPGKPFIGIIAERDLEIELVIPSQWVRWLTVGAPLTFSVDETGSAYPASVKRMGAAVDPISQTIKIVAVFSLPAAAVLSGMSGTAEFTKPGG
jgi:membrane fusion protein, multidrug efflux system